VRLTKAAAEAEVARAAAQAEARSRAAEADTRAAAAEGHLESIGDPRDPDAIRAGTMHKRSM